ncbi:hypothetical protein A6C57_25670 [Fibrella sp. ES10-3-2-2]|nr:hypothetical protein A6C57_25670 [Fibrella sp. ES10-3-2-2]
MNIIFDMAYSGESPGGDLKAAMRKSAEDQIKQIITDRLSQIEGFDKEELSIKVDMDTGKVHFSNISSPETLAKIQEVMKRM